MKKVIYSTLLATSLLATPIYSLNCYAAETVVEEDSFKADKTVTYNANKSYNALTFVIEFETAGDYSGVIINKDSKFECSQVDETHLTCTASNIEQGNIEIQLHNNDGSGKIGEVSIKMSMASNNATSTIDNISVGEDLADFDLHFEDYTLIGSWADSTVGNINVKITNVDSAETIMNENVNGTSFTCDIPEYTKQIMVTVVPSSSASVEGAGKTQIIDVKKSANGTVTFDSLDYTNKDTINVNTQLNDTYSIIVFDNDIQIFTVEEKSAGTYNYDIPVSEEGENNLKLFLVDQDGNMYSTSKKIVRDTVGPELSFNYEYDNRSTTESIVELSGNVKNFESLVVNETPVDVSTDGSFTTEVKLHLGTNEINFIATDIAGNETISTFNITMVEKKPNIIPLIALLLLLISGIGYWIYKKNKNKPKKEKRVKTENKNDKNEKQRIPLKYRIEQIKHNKLASYIVTVLLTLVFSYYFFFVLFAFIGVSSASMEPTLMTGDLTVENRLAYSKRDVQRGDVVTFYHTEKGKRQIYGKRVVGLPNDVISFHDGNVYINDELLVEDYIDSELETNCQKEFVVPADSYFMLGDNREVSADSRYWEDPYINKSDIIAKYMFSIPTHIITQLF